MWPYVALDYSLHMFAQILGVMLRRCHACIARRPQVYCLDRPGNMQLRILQQMVVLVLEVLVGVRRLHRILVRLHRGALVLHERCAYIFLRKFQMLVMPEFLSRRLCRHSEALSPFGGFVSEALSPLGGFDPMEVLAPWRLCHHGWLRHSSCTRGYLQVYNK